MDSPPGGDASRLLVLGGAVVTLGDPPVVRDGAVLVEGEDIVWVGSREDLEASEDRPHRRLGGPDSIVMPGFANAHQHSDFELGYRWLQYPIERGAPHALNADLSDELALLTATLAACDKARSGQTTILDFVYGRPRLPLHGYDALARAYKAVGLQATLALAFRDQNLLVHGSDWDGRDIVEDGEPAGYGIAADRQFELFSELHTRLGSRGPVRVMVAPDWTPACSDRLLDRCALVAAEADVPLTIHVLETNLEAEHGRHATPQGVMAHLREHGILGPRTSCAHFVWPTDKDIEILAETGSTAVFNPGSNLRLGSGIPPIRRVMTAGADIAFGTDGLSFSLRDDLLEEVRVGEHLQRPAGDLESGRLASQRLLDGLCRAGARAADAPRSGTIAIGSRADMVLLDGVRFGELADSTGADLLDLIVDAGSRDDVRCVVAGGVVVVDDQVVCAVDEAYLVRQLATHPARVPSRPARVEEALDQAVLEHYRAWLAQAGPAASSGRRTSPTPA